MRLLKMLPVLISAALAAGALTVAAFAEQYVNESGAVASGTTETHVVWTVYRDGDLHLEPLSSSFDDDVIKGDTPWEDYLTVPADDGPSTVIRGRDFIKRLIVEDKIITIGDEVFSDYPNLKSVVLPDLNFIGKSAFLGCVSLETVEVKGSVDTIYEYAFAGCGNLKTVKVDGTVETVGRYAFSAGSAGESGEPVCDTSLVSFDAAVTRLIDKYAFEGCSSLAHIGPIRGDVDTSAFKDTALSGKNVYAVSGNKIGIASDALPSGTKLIYTGTKTEYYRNVTNRTGIEPEFQRIGDDVTWTLEDGVLTITGSGDTVKLLDWTEQPWVNTPDAGTQAEQLDNIEKVYSESDIRLVYPMLDCLGDRLILRYAVAVTNGTGEGEFLPGETVTVKADPVGEYRRFNKWTGLDGVTFISGDESAAEVRFAMPSRDVDAKAHYMYPNSFVITALANPAEGGRVNGAGEYDKDTEAYLVPVPNEGYEFVNWTENGEVVNSLLNYSFIVKNDRTVTANFKKSLYTLTVDGGTGGGEYAPGTAVTVRAFDAREDEHFKEWVPDPATDLEFIEGGLASETIKFHMPESDLKLTAVYESLPWHTLTVNGGLIGYTTGMFIESNSDVFTEGSEIVIKADPAPAGQRFREWVWTGAGDLTFTDSTDKTDKEAYIVMPDRDVTLTPVYDNITAPFVGLNSLVLSGKIGLNFFTDLSDLSDEEKAGSYMTFAITGKGGCTERDDFDAGFMNDTGAYYGFTCYVNSIQMADSITPTFHFVRDGEEKTVTGYAYSIRNYVRDFMDYESAFDDTTAALVRALADYGYYAQHYLQQLHGWKFGESGYAEMKTRFRDEYIINGSGDGSDLQYKLDGFYFGRYYLAQITTDIRCSLTLDSDTALNAYFEINKDYPYGYELFVGKYDANIDDYVEIGEGSYILEEDGNRLRITVPGISAQNLGERYLFQLIFKSRTADINFSALSYLKELIAAHGHRDDAATYAAAAIYDYWEAANNWIAAHQDP